MRLPTLRAIALLSLCPSLFACGGADSRLALRRVVLYQNGIGYFERAGELHGDRYRLQLRSHEVGDVLKSLIVIDHSAGRQRAVSAVVPQPEVSQKTGAKTDAKSGANSDANSDQTWLDVLLQERGSGVFASGRTTRYA